jgi:Ca2+-binding RTX toxin-like protein
MGLFSGITKFIRNFADDVLGLDPNGGGIYSVFDNVLGIDPNGGGVFTLFKDLGIKVDAQDFYKVLNQAISQGLKYVIVSITGVPVQIDIDLFKNPSQNLFLGNDNILGSAANEVFDGRSGNDTISGLGGNDYINGGDGIDTAIYRGDRSEYNIIFHPDFTSINDLTSRDGIDHLVNVENIKFADSLIDLSQLRSNGAVFHGLESNDLVIGGQGSDTLDGKEGNDSLSGGFGDDLYIIDSVNDSIIENTGQGTDLINSYVDYTISNNVENLVLLGNSVKGTGNDLNNVIIGNNENNLLIGGNGNDVLNDYLGNDTLDGGAGNDNLYAGAGDNLLIGGDGDDNYYISNTNDIIIESASTIGGFDTVITRTHYSLANSAYNVERLIIENGFSGTIFGNNENNQLIGANGNDILNDYLGNDTLDGGGGNDNLYAGAGNNLLIGGDGDDNYYIDNANDVIIELASTVGGFDTVVARTSYVLANNVEKLVLDNGFQNAIKGTGNSLDNIIYGNTNWNIIDGGDGNDFLNGEAGNDTMIGGLGNDTYIVDWAGDVVIEDSTASTEIDTVQSYVSYTLGANLENLTLLNGEGISATGNAINNVIAGNALNNIFTGGAGVDTFVLSKTSVDTITDFAANEKLQISASAFGGGLNVGNLAANQILVGAGATAATAAAQRFIFNTTDKSLYFDVDGLNNASAVKIGVLSGVSTLSSANFSIGV